MKSIWGRSIWGWSLWDCVFGSNTSISVSVGNWNHTAIAILDSSGYGNKRRQ